MLTDTILQAFDDVELPAPADLLDRLLGETAVQAPSSVLDLIGDERPPRRPPHRVGLLAVAAAMIAIALTAALVAVSASDHTDAPPATDVTPRPTPTTQSPSPRDGTPVSFALTTARSSTSVDSGITAHDLEGRISGKRIDATARGLSVSWTRDAPTGRTLTIGLLDIEGAFGECGTGAVLIRTLDDGTTVTWEVVPGWGDGDLVGVAGGGTGMPTAATSVQLDGAVDCHAVAATRPAQTGARLRIETQGLVSPPAANGAEISRNARVLVGSDRTETPLTLTVTRGGTSMTMAALAQWETYDQHEPIWNAEVAVYEGKTLADSVVNTVVELAEYDGFVCGLDHTLTVKLIANSGDYVWVIAPGQPAVGGGKILGGATSPPGDATTPGHWFDTTISGTVTCTG